MQHVAYDTRFSCYFFNQLFYHCSFFLSTYIHVLPCYCITRCYCCFFLSSSLQLQLKLPTTTKTTSASAAAAVLAGATFEVQLVKTFHVRKFSAHDLASLKIVLPQSHLLCLRTAAVSLSGICLVGEEVHASAGSAARNNGKQ